jgi:hypothetical protein
MKSHELAEALVRLERIHIPGIHQNVQTRRDM